MLVVIVSLPNIDEGKHHKNKGLQGDDKNVKERPGCASKHMAKKPTAVGV